MIAFQMQSGMLQASFFSQIDHHLSVEILDVYIIKCGYKSGNSHNPRTNNLLMIYSFIKCIYYEKNVFLSLEIQVHEKIKLKIIILSRNKASRWFLFVFKIERGKQIVVPLTNFSIEYVCTISFSVCIIISLVHPMFYLLVFMFYFCK